MKKMQNRLSAGLVGLAIAILLIGGCKKELTTEVEGPKLKDLNLSADRPTLVDKKNLELVQVEDLKCG